MPLLVCRNLKKGSEWHAAVSADSFTLGFSEAATVPLPDRTLRPNEALVRKTPDRWEVVDLAEKDRVRLNGAVIRAAVLSDGDVLQIGSIAICFLEDVPQGDWLVAVKESKRSKGREFAPWTREVERLTFEESSRGAGPPEAPARLPWLVMVLCAVGFAVGIALGYRGFPLRFGSEASQSRGRDTRTEKAGESIASRGKPASQTAPGPESPPGKPSRPPESLERLKEELARGSEPSGDSRESAAAVVPASTDMAAQSLSPALVRLKAISAGFAARDPDGPATSRLRLHRLFLDILERPPTRGEEKDLLERTEPERWAAILSLAPLRPAWLESPEEAARRLLGREPGEAEKRELAGISSPELPAAFWLSLGEEYARAERRRAKSPRQLAASLIVDLQDRVPSNDEIEAVRTALEAAGSSALKFRSARAIAFSPSSQLGAGEEAGARWEEEFFRFALREPTPSEREELGRAYENLERGERRRWLILALSTLPEYGTY